MGRGKFIVFEGIDGSGKSTQVDLLADRLRDGGHAVHVTKEPSDRFVGKSIRKVLQREQTVPHKTLAAMFLADRYDHILGNDGLLEHLDNGEIVICDRYYWSSFAYHSLDLDMDFVIDLHRNVFELLNPDVTIYLDIAPAQSMQRIGKRSTNVDLFEKENLLTAIRDNYLTAFDKLNTHRIEKIDATQTIEQISQQIFDLVTD